MYLSSPESLRTFPTVVVPFCLPSENVREAGGSTSLSTSEVTSILCPFWYFCGFSLHFHDD